MKNSKLSISLMRSDGRELIGDSMYCGETHGRIETLRSRSDGKNKMKTWARVVGHDFINFARSDGSDLIANQTVRASRGNFPLKTDVFSFF